jgi:hypothetical protein
MDDGDIPNLDLIPDDEDIALLNEEEEEAEEENENHHPNSEGEFSETSGK